MAQKPNQRQSQQQSQQLFWMGHRYQAARGGGGVVSATTKEAAKASEEKANTGHAQPRARKTKETEERTSSSNSPRLSRSDHNRICVCIPPVTTYYVCARKKKMVQTTQLLTVHALQSKGVKHIATEVARLQLPLAGRISNFISNWEGAGLSYGLQDRIPAEAKSKPRTTSNCLHREGRGMHAGRDPKHARQTGYLRNRRQPPGLLLPYVSCSKDRWQAKTCNKLETSQ